MFHRIFKVFSMILAAMLLFVSAAGAQESCTRDSVLPEAGNCGYDVQDYQLNMTWELDGDHWDVTEVITFTSEWDTDELWFDFTDTYEITSLTIDGTKAAYERKPKKLIVRHQFAHDTEYKLRAAFNGKLLWGEIFDPTGETRDPKEGFCMLNEPTNAWRFYICNDHPKDKASFYYSFTVPANYVPAGNGRLLTIEEADGTTIVPGEYFIRSWNPESASGTVTFTYAQETLTAPYLFTVCAGAYDMKQQTLDNGKVQLDFVAHDHENPDMAWTVAGQQAEIISALEPFFGEYPYEDLGGIFANTNLGAALETQGRSLYDNDTTSLSVAAHEITHQWIGDLISVADWSDLWLKEGAATFGEALWEEHYNGKDAYNNYIAGLYLAAVQEASAGPKEIHPEDIVDLYGVSAYYGGSILYYSLRDRLGDEVFSKALQTLIEENKWGTVNEEKFIEVFNRVSGEDLTDFIKSFLYYGESGHIPDLPGILSYEEALDYLREAGYL